MGRLFLSLGTIPPCADVRNSTVLDFRCSAESGDLHYDIPP